MLAHRMLANGTGMKDELIELVETPDGSYVTLWYHSDTVANVIRPLVRMEYLEYTIPDKTNSPNQKYRKKQK